MNELELVTISGSHRQAGRKYGEIFHQKLAGFLCQEVLPNSERLKYAKACWKKTNQLAPASAEFMRGISLGSKLSIEEVTLLALHEEIVHQTHCTAFASTGAGTRSGHALIGQNWDWKTWRYPWPGLLRLKVKDAPRLLTYHYPGLWASLGMNQHGLSLMWTGGGYNPPLRPKIGVPTYALIYDLLQRKNTKEAVSYLQMNQQAGCFLFFLADGEGDIAVVEGIPGHLSIENDCENLSRANHFECVDIVKAARQKLPKKTKSNTGIRGELAKRFIKNKGAPNSVASFKDHLTSNKEIYRLKKEHMTIDSFVGDCKNRMLHVSRGGHQPGPWKTYKV